MLQRNVGWNGAECAVDVEDDSLASLLGLLLEFVEGVRQHGMLRSETAAIEIETSRGKRCGLSSVKLH